jgi:hypothetical protein
VSLMFPPAGIVAYLKEDLGRRAPSGGAGVSRGNPIADAVLDRLVHSAHRLELKGDSLRKLRAAKNTGFDETSAN